MHTAIASAIPSFTLLDHLQRARLDAVAKLQAFPWAVAKWFGSERSAQIHREINDSHRPFGQAIKPAYLYHVIARDETLIKFVVNGEAR